MDSSSDDEECEYFETMENISSSSTSDSGSETDQHSKERRVGQLNAKAKPPNGFSLESRYAVWRNDPRSIRERRKDLFQLMGLQDQRRYSKADQTDLSPANSKSATTTTIQGSSSTSTSLSVPPASGASPVSSESSNIDVVALKGSGSQNSLLPGSCNRNFVKGSEIDVSAPADTCPLARSVSWDDILGTEQSSDTVFRSRSDNKGRDSLLRGIKASVPDKPVLERFLDNSGAVLRQDPAFNSNSDQQKDTNKKAFKRKQKEGFGLTTKPPLPLPLGSAYHEGEISSFPTRELWNEPSSSSRGSIADIPQAVEDSRSSQETISKELVCRVKDLDTGKEFIVHELGTDGLWNKLREVGTGKEFTMEEFEKSLGLSPIAKEVKKRARAAGTRSDNGGKLADREEVKHKKKGWLRRIAHFVKVPKEKKIEESQGSDGKQINISDTHEGPSIQRYQKVKVRVHRKDVKEFSELYMGQEFKAHEGPIWALKFSLDGHHFATGGQDCFVRVWQINDHHTMANRCNEDPPSSKTSEARASEIDGTSQPSKSFWVWGDQSRSRRGADRRSNSTKDVQFTRGFFIIEKAVRCFAGHKGDILDLAWSRPQFLLSSSMDKTVRLWHVDNDDCLRTFSHSDYVTCIEFNPVDGRYFISGSLDGKVRIWSVLDNQVVDWMDAREMVTAACFTPDGKGAVVGTFKGLCRIYKTTGAKLQLDAQLVVKHAKKQKSRGKKIAGIQFMPGNITKMLITSNDSRIRMFEGVELCCKFKGFRNASSQISASFSSDGQYIVCASEDSRVYIWNSSDVSPTIQKVQRKKTDQATESFHSPNVTVAMPWPGTSTSPNPEIRNELNRDEPSMRQSEETTIDPVKPNDVDALSSLNSINKHDHEQEAVIGAGDSKMASKHSSFTSIYFDCLSIAGDTGERSTTNSPSMSGYTLGNRFSCETSGRRSLRKSHSRSWTAEFSALDILSATGSSLVASPTSHIADKASTVPNEGYDSSAAWSRPGLANQSLEVTPEVTTLNAPVGAKSATSEDVTKTQLPAASPACDMIILAASLYGDIRAYQKQKH